MDKKQCERMFEQMQPPKAVVQPQKIFVLVFISTWTSSPQTISYFISAHLPVPFCENPYAADRCVRH